MSLMSFRALLNSTPTAKIEYEKKSPAANLIFLHRKFRSDCEKVKILWPHDC